jgi:hypothetical protein
MKIVGPVRLRTIHTLLNEKDEEGNRCITVTELDDCYYREINDETVLKTEFENGMKF